MKLSLPVCIYYDLYELHMERFTHTIGFLRVINGQGLEPVWPYNVRTVVPTQILLWKVEVSKNFLIDAVYHF